MKVSELRQFLYGRPYDEEVKIQFVVVYKDKGISIDLRGVEVKGLWPTHCSKEECILHFQPNLKYRDEFNLM